MSNVVPFRPSDTVVLAALVEAGRLLERRADEPASRLSERARYIVAAAMQEVFDRLTVREIGRCIDGDRDLGTFGARLHNARQSRWWSDAMVEEIIGEITSHYIGEQA